MKGTRPLDNSEIRLVSACFDGTFEARNRGLFMIGVSTGGRISELLSLQIGDVWQNGKAVTDLLYEKNPSSRAVRSAVPCQSTKTVAKRLRISSLGIVNGTKTPKPTVRYSRLATTPEVFLYTGNLHTRC